MDPWAINVKFNNPSLIFGWNSLLEKPISPNLAKVSNFSIDDWGSLFEIRSLKSKNYSSVGYNNSFIVKASGKKNSDNSPSSSGNDDCSTPGDDNSKGNNSSQENNGSNIPSQRTRHTTQNWREVRATLFAREQVESTDSSTRGPDELHTESEPLGLKWAHPISLPETGSILVATEKLDGVRSFERTVVLLLRSGTRRPREGPFGVVINRPLHKKMKHMKPNNLDITTTFADCSLHFGGPLETNMFLFRTGEKSKPDGFEEVIPGLCFGYRNRLVGAMELVKKGAVLPQDFRFFVGYAGWQFDQLQEEIECNFWHVAACSSTLLFGTSSDGISQGLWEEVLQLMGGQYSELSRKPKQEP